jgi:biotin synthase
VKKLLKDILQQDSFSHEELTRLLSVKTEDERNLILEKAQEVRERVVGNNIYLRGLIELSNYCEKNCRYCGIRAGNKKVNRYCLNQDEIIAGVKHAWEQKYGSVVIQSGERTDLPFIRKIDQALLEINYLTGGRMRVTLSCGEQKASTYRQWYDSGAHRYLLRIETTNRDIYYQLHPNNRKHKMARRFDALENLKEIGYQTGSGVMIGLPGQTPHDLANDLLFMKEMDVDMVGMGPYIEHEDTPLYKLKDRLLTPEERLNLSLLMIAVLRILMPDINIAAATALDSLSPEGRILALKAGANVLMPNLTPLKYREDYFLYDNKPYLSEAEDLISRIENSSTLDGYKICFNEHGDSKHYQQRKAEKR